MAADGSKVPHSARTVGPGSRRWRRTMDDEQQQCTVGGAFFNRCSWSVATKRGKDDGEEGPAVSHVTFTHMVGACRRYGRSSSDGPRAARTWPSVARSVGRSVRTRHGTVARDGVYSTAVRGRLCPRRAGVSRIRIVARRRRRWWPTGSKAPPPTPPLATARSGRNVRFQWDKCKKSNVNAVRHSREITIRPRPVANLQRGGGNPR